MISPDIVTSAAFNRGIAAILNCGCWKINLGEGIAVLPCKDHKPHVLAAIDGKFKECIKYKALAIFAQKRWNMTLEPDMDNKFDSDLWNEALKEAEQ